MSEPVQVIAYQFEHFPAKFKLSETQQIIDVEAIEQCWTEMSDHRNGSKYHFRVRCGRNSYRLTEDLGSGQWSIQPEQEPS